MALRSSIVYQPIEAHVVISSISAKRPRAAGERASLPSAGHGSTRVDASARLARIER
jgi:hypothetical protein